MSPDALPGYEVALPLAHAGAYLGILALLAGALLGRVMGGHALGLAAPLSGTVFAVAPPIGGAGPAKSPPEARISEDRRRDRRPRWAGGRELQGRVQAGLYRPWRVRQGGLQSAAAQGA